MIVLCPTRELARQVEEELSAVCKPLGLFSAVFHGGVSYDGQVSNYLLPYRSGSVVVCALDCFTNSLSFIATNLLTFVSFF
jgi:superfamily II DNA/RNA helicase